MRRWLTVVVCALVVGVAGGVASAGPAASEPGLEVTFLPAPPPVVSRATPAPIRVVNTLPGKAMGVTLTLRTPSAVRLTAPGCHLRRALLVCALRDLDHGEGVIVRLRMTLTKPGSYRIVAKASAKTVQANDSTATTVRAIASAASPHGTISRVSPALARRMNGVSWHRGCPVGLDQLRVLRVSYWDFAGTVRAGTLIVNRDAAAPLLRVFGRLFELRFPIRRMTPVDAYGAADYRSIEADNTSAFNCRPVAGTSRWSEHAYGRAVDLDPLENPYVSGDTTSHPRSRRYLDRSLRLPG
jgi:hypothetical protein